MLAECRRIAGKKSLVLLPTALALSGQSMNPRIAVGRILHESNTFPSDLTGLGDLRGRSIRRGHLQEQSNCVAARRDRVGPRQSLRNAAAEFCDAATSNLAPVIAECGRNIEQAEARVKALITADGAPRRHRRVGPDLWRGQRGRPARRHFGTRLLRQVPGRRPDRRRLVRQRLRRQLRPPPPRSAAIPGARSSTTPLRPRAGRTRWPSWPSCASSRCLSTPCSARTTRGLPARTRELARQTQQGLSQAIRRLFGTARHPAGGSQLLGGDVEGDFRCDLSRNADCWCSLAISSPPGGGTPSEHSDGARCRGHREQRSRTVSWWGCMGLRGMPSDCTVTSGGSVRWPRGCIERSDARQPDMAGETPRRNPGGAGNGFSRGLSGAGAIAGSTPCNRGFESSRTTYDPFQALLRLRTPVPARLRSTLARCDADSRGSPARLVPAVRFLRRRTGPQCVQQRPECRDFRRGMAQGLPLCPQHYMVPAPLQALPRQRSLVLRSDSSLFGVLARSRLFVDRDATCSANGQAVR